MQFFKNDNNVRKNKLLIISIACLFILRNLILITPVEAATYTETFGSACYSLSTGLSVKYSGNELSIGTGPVYYSTDASGTANFSGCNIKLISGASRTGNLVITFPNLSRASSVTLDAYAVNGTQTIVVNFTDSTSANWLIPDTVNASYPSYMGRFTYTSAGKTISTLTFTPVNTPDQWLFDNLNWTSASAPPAVSISPSISGTTTYGQLLTSSTGTWTDTPTSYSYQWSRANSSNGTYTSISGASNSTYTLTSSDVGKYIKVAVTASNGGGATTDTSTATSAITTATSSATITIAIGAIYYRTVKLISATPSVAGKITFRANNIIIPGCKNLAALANTSKNCSYRPNTRGYVTFSATLIPSDSGYSNSTVTSANNFVNQRSGNR